MFNNSFILKVQDIQMGLQEGIHLHNCLFIAYDNKNRKTCLET